jgi:opacity protein-like surface antigen
MTKKLIVTCVLLLPFNGVIAQTTPMIGPTVVFGIHANVGFVNLPGPSVNSATPLEDVYGIGYGGGVHLDIEFAMLSVRVAGDYITFSPDDENYRNALAGLEGSTASDFSIDGGRVDILHASVNGKLSPIPLPIVSPYLVGGIGLARISADAAEVKFQGTPAANYPGFESETGTAASLGVGLDLDFFVSTFIEAKYVWIFLKGENSGYLPITLGINL